MTQQVHSQNQRSCLKVQAYFAVRFTNITDVNKLFQVSENIRKCQSLPRVIPRINKPGHVVFLSSSYHSVLWMDHLFNLLQLPQHWPHPHPHHQQTLQGWLHSYWCVHQELCHPVMNREEERCQSFQFKALTHSFEYFMMSRLLSVII